MVVVAFFPVRLTSFQADPPMEPGLLNARKTVERGTCDALDRGFGSPHIAAMQPFA